ncbi:hypothetical protein V7148_18205 [Gottfriedia acidiceleris]|uniref:hypothetical protein n=1 Tax=Bacillaceae TaxID=186817 RepID=UPI001144655C|nr:hypothetical protein [Bacillus sp. AFS096315]
MTTISWFSCITFRYSSKEGLTFGSVLDPDMNPKSVEETREFSTKEVIDHLTGKEKLTDDEVEELKRAAKYNRNT